MSRKLYIKTFGCQMNEYDSAKTAHLLAESHALELTQDPALADVLLVNTCSIREKAQEKVFSQLGQWRAYKNERNGVVIGVGGCVASQEGEAIRARAPYVDLVFGPQTLHRVPQMLDAIWRDRKPRVDVSFPEIEKFDCLPAPRADGPNAFVSVMEGCDRHCAYCVVPTTRGPEFSRRLEDVLAEVHSLAAQGVKEVSFLGQNVNAYRGALADGGEADLARLIGRAAEVPGISRIRYTTSHPADVSEDLIQAYTRVPELVSHLHLPVQSGSDRILQRMDRGYTAEQYLQKVRGLREARPDISISTDFIVGFPGETEVDFEDTMALVAAVGFDHSFSFVFSPRPGTPAATLNDDTPMDEKKARLARLQTRINSLARGVSAGMVGSTQRVLVQGPSKKDRMQMAGRTDNNRVVNFSAPESLRGEFVQVRVTEALPNSLRGQLLTPAPLAA
ncbi:MAG: tRNA (N6-isopentenyl adenosine(37)-C2)-methylthiotransferase MiaB [Gammaproteobacteria bacterium]|nr:MAG: tRNA (N6-isopentenyl adenosine(37)-C2)-methylthiotransferase MiaB [Gammaproteobacteria bacterium]